MFVAIGIQEATAPQGQSRFGVSLRVELDKLDAVICDPGQEGEVVVFGHGVGQGYEKFVLHRLDRRLVFLVKGFRFQRRKRDAAAGEHGVPCGMDHVAADGTDVERGPQQIGRPVPVDDRFAVHQFDDRGMQGRSQRLQQGKALRSNWSAVPLLF